jgi:hypothetical protein
MAAEIVKKWIGAHRQHCQYESRTVIDFEIIQKTLMFNTSK